MSKREEDNGERGRREHEKKDDRRRHERPHGTGYGTERTVYLEFLARRWQGSIPPTPQAYARALGQWRQLPGSILTAATDLGMIPKSSPPPPDDSSQKPRKQGHHPGKEERHS
jgi:hypothetical protein